MKIAETRICVIGDSHSYSGWQCISIPGVSINIKYLGAKLMYSFGKEKWILLDKDFSGDVVVFCFGEIDARCHIHKYKNKGFQEIINDLVKSYLEIISLNVKGFPNLKTCIYFVPPAIKKADRAEDSCYPYLGTDEERRNYVICLNEKLSEGCKERGFIFVDLYDQYCDEKGFMRNDMSDQGPHIENIVPLGNFIHKYLVPEEVKRCK